MLTNTSTQVNWKRKVFVELHAVSIHTILFFLLFISCQMFSFGERCRPLHFTASTTPFSSNNVKQSFSIWLYKCLTSLWKNFNLLFFKTLLYFIEVCMQLKHFSLVELWTLGHCSSLIVFFFSNSVVALLLCLASLSWCMTQFQAKL